MNTTLYGYTALEAACSSREINTSQSELIEKKKKKDCFCLRTNLHLNYPLGMKSLDYQMIKESYRVEKG